MLPHVGIEPAHLSQQLAVLRRANLVVGRKEGSTVYYSLTDPHVAELLRVARTILSGVLTGQAELLADLQATQGRPGPCHDGPGVRASGAPAPGSAGTDAAPGGPPGGSG